VSIRENSKILTLPKTEAWGNLPTQSMASYEVQRTQRSAQNLLTIFQSQSLFDATKGVFSPGPDDPKTLYGRVRFIGLLCVYAVSPLFSQRRFTIFSAARTESECSRLPKIGGDNPVIDTYPVRRRIPADVHGANEKC